MHAGMWALPVPALPVCLQGPPCGSAWNLLGEVSWWDLLLQSKGRCTSHTNSGLPTSEAGHWNTPGGFLPQSLCQKQPVASRGWGLCFTFGSFVGVLTSVTYIEIASTCKGVLFYLKTRKREMSWVWGALLLSQMRGSDFLPDFFFFLSRTPAAFYKKTNYFWNATPAQRKWITTCQNCWVNTVLCG